LQAERELPGGLQTVALKLLRIDVHDAGTCWLRFGPGLGRGCKGAVMPAAAGRNNVPAKPQVDSERIDSAVFRAARRSSAWGKS
jgi:hypothetical protein